MAIIGQPDYGSLLFDEKPAGYRLVRMWVNPLWILEVPVLAMSLLTIGLLVVIMSLPGLPYAPWLALPVLAGLVMVYPGIRLFFASMWSFKVYEKGLGPLREGLPLFPFFDLECLRILHGRLEPVTKKGHVRDLVFLDRPGKRLEPEVRARLGQMLIGQMKRNHPNEDPLVLTRQLSTVDRSEEAYREYLRRMRPSTRQMDLFPEGDIRAAISEEVLKQGRDRVELADVRRLLR